MAELKNIPKFTTRKQFLRYIINNPVDISTEQYQQIYSNLSTTKTTKKHKVDKYLENDFSTTGKILTTVFLLDNDGKKVRQHIISSVEGIQRRHQRRDNQKYQNIKKLFSREGIDDNFLLNSFYLFIQNNSIHKKGKSIKKLLYRFLSSYNHKKQEINTNLLPKLFDGVKYPLCSDFLAKYL